jgi:hypothetical protein
MRRRLAALYGNLRAGARLALFMRVRPFDYHASPVDFAWLLAFNFAVWVTVAFVRAGLAGEFDGGAIAAYLTGVPIVLAGAYAVAAIYGMPERTMLIATALNASDATFELIGFLVPEAAAGGGARGRPPPGSGVAVLATEWLIY